MMNTQQPKALFLACQLDEYNAGSHPYPKKAATELRRLHSVNAELLEALQTMLKHPDTMTAKLVAQAAIAKAEGLNKAQE